MAAKTYCECLDTQDRHSKIAAELAAELAKVGWKISSRYFAVEGSLYLKCESDDEHGYRVTVRIADHENLSARHPAPEVQIITDGDSEFDLADVLRYFASIEEEE